MEWKNCKTQWYEADSSAFNFPFLQEVLQNSFVSSLQIDRQLQLHYATLQLSLQLQLQLELQLQFQLSYDCNYHYNYTTASTTTSTSTTLQLPLPLPLYYNYHYPYHYRYTTTSTSTWTATTTSATTTATATTTTTTNSTSTTLWLQLQAQRHLQLPTSTTLQWQLQLQLLQPPSTLHYNYSYIYNYTTPHYIQQLWMRWLTPGLSIGVPTSELLRSYFLVKSWFWLVNKPVLAGQISMRSPVSGLKPATVWFRSHVYPIFNRQPPGSLSKEPSPKSFDCTWLHCSPTRKRKDLNTFKLYGAILLHVFQDSWSKQIFNQPFEVSKPVPQVSPRRLEPA